MNDYLIIERTLLLVTNRVFLFKEISLASQSPELLVFNPLFHNMPMLTE